MMMMPFICSYRNKAQAQSKEGTFSAVLQVHSCRMGREPGAGMMRVLEGRAEAVAGTMNAQAVANTQLPAQQAQESPWTHEYSKTHAKCYW